MLYRVIAAAACVLMLAGCQPSGAERGSIASPTAPSSPSVAAADSPQNKPDVPFSGVVAGEAVFDFIKNPKGCPTGFTTITDVKGTATHLGKTAWYSEHCISMETGSITGDLVLTAADGDKIYATYTASSGPLPEIGDPIPVTGTIVFSGGTGRFVTASGSAELTAAVIWEGFGDFSSPGRWEWRGSIRY